MMSYSCILSKKITTATHKEWKWRVLNEKRRKRYGKGEGEGERRNGQQKQNYVDVVRYDTVFSLA